MNTPMLDTIAKIRGMGKIVNEKKNGYWYYECQCTAHEDKTPSLRVGQDSQGILMVKCFAGCDTDAILASLQMEKGDMLPSHLKAEFIKKKTEQDLCSVENFAARKKLPKDFLNRQGLTDRENCFKIEYIGVDNKPLLRYRLRIALSGKKHSLWDSENKGAPITAYGLHFIKWANENFKYIIIVEGESDALTLWYNQMPCLGIPGASNTKLLPVELLIGFPEIVIASEPDDAGQKFPDGIANQLQERGYEGKITILNFSNIPMGNDISDLWINCGADKEIFKENLIKHLEIASNQGGKTVVSKIEANNQITSYKRPAGNPRRKINPTQVKKPVAAEDYSPKRLNSTDSLKIVEHYLRTAWTYNNKILLKQYMEDFYQYTNGFWEIISNTVLTSKIIEYLDNMEILSFDKAEETWNWEPLKIRYSMVKEILAMLSNNLVVIQTEQEAPFWIVKPDNWTERKIYFPMKNCIFEITEKKEMPKTPDFFNLSALSFDYKKNAKQPRKWLEFLNQLFPEDYEKDQIIALQQWFGYCISGKTDLQKMLMIIGLRRCGKGTISKILTEILGSNNVTNPTLNSFCENKGMQSIIGRSLAIFNDVRLGYKADNTIAVERLLSISGEDSISVPRMYKKAIELKPKCRIMMISNILPKLNDQSTALASRFLILKINQSFLGKENIALFEQLKKELPLIFNWGIDGLRKITDLGLIKEPDTSKKIREELEGLQSPVSSFVKEFCYVEKDYFEKKDDLYKSWKIWCDESGLRPTGKKVFFRDLDSIYPCLKSIQKRFGYERHYVLTGIGLNPDGRKNESQNDDKKWDGYND